MMEKEWVLGEGAEDPEEPAKRLRYWNYVLKPVPRLPEDRELSPGDERDKGHESWGLKDFMNRVECKDAQLHEAEVISLRLYTGPAFTLINRSSRSNTGDFPYTMYCLESAIIKMADRNREKHIIYRGLKGQMPEKFAHAYFESLETSPDGGDRNIADPAFMSATRNMDIALGNKYGGNVLFVFQCGAPQHNEITGQGWLKGGASVSWVSQFPREEEVLMPRYTELAYCLSAKRFEGWTVEMKRATADKEVYEFEPSYAYDYTVPCPYLPGTLSNLNGRLADLQR